MSHRRAAIAAWGLCAFTLTAAACAAGLSIGVADTDWGSILPEATPPDEGVLVALLDVAWVVAFTVVGAFLASHAPRNPVGWLLQPSRRRSCSTSSASRTTGTPRAPIRRRRGRSRSSGCGSPTAPGSQR